jgi:hypothetical protein
MAVTCQSQGCRVCGKTVIAALLCVRTTHPHRITFWTLDSFFGSSTTVQVPGTTYLLLSTGATSIGMSCHTSFFIVP